MNLKLILAALAIAVIVPLTAFAGEEDVETELARAVAASDITMQYVTFDDAITEAGTLGDVVTAFNNIVDQDSIVAVADGSELGASL